MREQTEVAAILSEPGREWAKKPGATAGEIERLVAIAPYPLPSPLLDLLRFSNGGGEGELALTTSIGGKGGAPRLFALDTVEEIITGIGDPDLRVAYDGLIFVGGNGGLERIALVCRVGAPPFPFVMIDPVAGLDSAEQIAADAVSFVASIRLEYRGQP